MFGNLSTSTSAGNAIASRTSVTSLSSFTDGGFGASISGCTSGSAGASGRDSMGAGSSSSTGGSSFMGATLSAGKTLTVGGVGGGVK